MKEKIAKLIDVKSIMTLLLTIVFCILALTKVITGTEFLTIFTTVVAFYFGTQSMKKAEEPKRPEPTGQQQEPAPAVIPAVADTVDPARYNFTHPDATVVADA